MTKRRHHYLPQFYLRNFANSKDRRNAWVYAKAGNIVHSATPRNLGIEKDYHTVTLADGTKDRHTIEETVAALENVAAPVVQKILRRASLTSEDNEIFAVFAAQMFLRVPARRDNAGRMMSEMLKHSAQQLAGNKESFHTDYRRFQEETGDQSDLDPEELRQYILGDDYVLTVNSSAALGLSFGAMEVVSTCFLRMQWAFLHRNGRFRLITCDNPVFCCDPTILPNTWHGVGLMNPGVEVSFPLSPDVVAFASYHPKRRRVQHIGPEVVRRFNQQTIDSAYRYIFACERSEKLETFISRNNDGSIPVEPYAR
jgi:hypothetical protein